MDNLKELNNEFSKSKSKEFQAECIRILNRYNKRDAATSQGGYSFTILVSQ